MNLFQFVSTHQYENIYGVCFVMCVPARGKSALNSCIVVSKLSNLEDDPSVLALGKLEHQKYAEILYYMFSSCVLLSGWCGPFSFKDC